MLVVLLRSAAGAQDGVQASNRQQVQQAQQGQNSGDRSEWPKAIAAFLLSNLAAYSIGWQRVGRKHMQ
jgi:hypothetical protein